MAGRYLPKLWFLFFTQLGCISASCSEPASAGRIQRAGNIAFQYNPLFLTALSRIGNRDGRDKGSGIWVNAVENQLIIVGQLHKLAQIHNTYAVTDVLDNAQVMGDE